MHGPKGNKKQVNPMTVDIWLVKFYKLVLVSSLQSAWRLHFARLKEEKILKNIKLQHGGKSGCGQCFSSLLFSLLCLLKMFEVKLRLISTRARSNRNYPQLFQLNQSVDAICFLIVHFHLLTIDIWLTIDVSTDQKPTGMLCNLCVCWRHCIDEV